MARSIYREWFVKFRFPGHEQVQMVDSELGLIPEGWEIKPVEELLSYHIGGGWGEEEQSNQYPAVAYVIRGTDIPLARLVSVVNCPLRFHKQSNFNSRKLELGDIVFEVSGGSKGQPVGRALLITQKLLKAFDSDVICASFCKLLRVNNKVILPELLYLHLLDIYSNGRIDKYQVQSTGITNFKFAFFLESEQLLVPPPQWQAKFNKIAIPIFESIQTLGAKNANLRQTRDLLLPRLITGEIDVENLDINTGPIAA
jgi:type I restriction enzyme S subunit